MHLLGLTVDILIARLITLSIKKDKPEFITEPTELRTPTPIVIVSLYYIRQKKTLQLLLSTKQKHSLQHIKQQMYYTIMIIIIIQIILEITGGWEGFKFTATKTHTPASCTMTTAGRNLPAT